MTSRDRVVSPCAGPKSAEGRWAADILTRLLHKSNWNQPSKTRSLDGPLLCSELTWEALGPGCDTVYRSVSDLTNDGTPGASSSDCLGVMRSMTTM
eukprot:5371894-Amphidinium_carterae.1